MITGLRHTHMGLGYLLVLSSSISLLLALANVGLGNHPTVVKIGTVLGRRVEPALMGIIALIGLGMWGLLRLPITTVYLWLGVVALFVQGGVTGAVTKPALIALAAGDDSAKFKWVVAAVINAFVIIGIFGAMQVKF